MPGTDHTEQKLGGAVAEETLFEAPPECSVIFYNDDFTTKDFVVEILVSVFDKNRPDAVALTEKAHRAGSVIAGVYTYDIAVTRANIAVTRARKQGFPLRVEVKRI